jgi:hypothetical protein
MEEFLRVAVAVERDTEASGGEELFLVRLVLADPGPPLEAGERTSADVVAA